MAAKWTARVLTGTLTIVFMTQPSFAAPLAQHANGDMRIATPARTSDLTHDSVRTASD